MRAVPESKITTLKDSSKVYLRSYLIPDIIALLGTIYALYTNNILLNRFSNMIRFVHYPSLFYPFHWAIERYSQASKKRTHQIITIISVFFFIVSIGHILACGWIIIGELDRDKCERKGWLYVNDFPEVNENRLQIYIFSYYWIFEVFTTVGYGDYTGGTSIEYAYSIFLEFFGVIINSLMIGIAGDFVSQSTSFDSLIAH